MNETPLIFVVRFSTRLFQNSFTKKFLCALVQNVLKAFLSFRRMSSTILSLKRFDKERRFSFGICEFQRDSVYTVKKEAADTEEKCVK